MRGLKFRGRPPIQIAESVRDVVNLSNPYAAAIMDRSVFLDEGLVDAVLGQSVFSWSGRNPTPALDEEGNFQGTDLDLLSFMMPMAERGAVIEIPHYRSRRPGVKRDNERHVGGGSRFGAITGLTSNQDVFSFSVRIYDNTVVTRNPYTAWDTVGAFRNFMLVDLDGTWHTGWDRIVFDPTAKENAFLTEKKLWSENTVFFKNAVHPNRWQSVFGAPYFLLKMLIERLREEGAFYRKEVKRLEKLGIRLAEQAPTATGSVHTASVTEQKKIKVKTLEAEMDLPEFSGAFVTMPDSQAGLAMADKHQRLLTYTLKPKAQFVVRADELAYFLHGDERVAPWMTGRSWLPAKTPGGRIVWNRMVLSNEVALRYRIHEVTETVASFTQWDFAH